MNELINYHEGNTCIAAVGPYSLQYLEKKCDPVFAPLLQKCIDNRPNDVLKFLKAEIEAQIRAR